MGFIEGLEKAVRVKVCVKPQSGENRFSLEGDELVYYTVEPPVKGRANASLVKALIKTLKVPREHVNIVYGVRDSIKVVEVRGVTVEEVKRRLLEALKKP